MAERSWLLMVAGLACALLFVSVPGFADLKTAMAESDLEKRSQLALKNADDTLKDARKAYEKGDMETVSAAASEIGASVELALKSLKQTGKNPRKSPKWFKRAEISTRELLRKLDNFQHAMSDADRPALEAVMAQVHDAHDDLLLGLMEGKRP